jgi:membrane-associated phospholipid phosphatase
VKLLIVTGLFVLTAAPASAQPVRRTIDLRVTPRVDPPPSTIRPQAEWALSSVMSSTVLFGTTMPNNEQAARWRGGILLDDPLRSAFSIESESARNAVARTSDVILFGLALAPVVIDAVLLAWLVDGDPELMSEMLLVNLQAHAVAQGLTALLKHAVARERPMSRACREGGDDCEEQAPESFFSGHASLAFTSAALICHYHAERSLLGGAGDAAMCATGMALAAGVGLMRVLSDRHYASDVAIGAAVGLLSGFLVPQYLNFGIADQPNGVNAAVGPMIDGEQYGVQVFGTF